jgi:septal ring factor EnvC (AmiA/AmiB activator)
VPWWTWLCLGIFLLAVVATAVFAVFAFGRLKRLAGAAETIQARIDDVAAAAEEMQRRQAHVQERLAELERHRARTEASIARLKILTSSVSSAFSEVTGLQRRHLRK